MSLGVEIVCPCDSLLCREWPTVFSVRGMRTEVNPSPEQVRDSRGELVTLVNGCVYIDDMRVLIESTQFLGVGRARFGQFALLFRSDRKSRVLVDDMLETLAARGIYPASSTWEAMTRGPTPPNSES